MPQMHDFLNKKEERDAIKLDNILVLEGRLHVTARWVAARFRIPLAIINSVIAELSKELDFPQLGGSVWLNANTFFDVSNHAVIAPLISEAGQAAVMQLLGDFPRRLGRVWGARDVTA